MLLEDTIGRIAPLDEAAMTQARKRQDALTKPQGSLGILESLSIHVAGITGNPLPKLENKVLFTMAGDHGVTDEGVSLYPKDVTAQMIENFIAGGAGINVLARHIGARVIVVDMGIAVDVVNPAVVVKKVRHGTGNIAKGPAMTRDEARRAVESGIEVFMDAHKHGIDIVGTGDMGIGNTTASSAITAAITGAPVDTVTGRGTGLDDEALRRKKAIIGQALAVNAPDPRDGLDVLAKVGGLEIGGIAGSIIAAAAHRVPVVIDGFISGAAALIAATLAPAATAYMIPAHASVECGHAVALAHLGLKPLLHLDLRLGEGTGAALGISLVDAACKLLTDMATFAEAGVSEAEGE